MGRPIDASPRFSPYKQRSPFGILSKKFNSMFSSAKAIGNGLRRSFTKAILNKTDKPNFASLPLEIAFHLFDLVKAEQLLLFCSLDHVHMNKMIAYLESECFASRLRSLLSSTSSSEDQNEMSLSEIQAVDGACRFGFSPTVLAQIIRVCHISKGNNAEKWMLSAQFIINLYMKVGSHKNAVHDHTFWGNFISKTAVDWTQLQFYEFLQNFVRVTGLHFRTEAFLLDDWETDKSEELILRNFIRPLFIENCNMIGFTSKYKGRAQELHFRVAALLNIFSMRSSSSHRFMLLLGAPINVNDNNQKYIDYQRISAEPIQDIESATSFLGDLPFLVKQLLLTNKLDIEPLRWTELEVFNFLEMLTTYPEPWVLRNFACFLVAEPELARIAIYIRALHGDPGEAGSTLHSCVEASILLGSNPNIIFHDTMFALHTKCTLPSRLTVIREAVSTSNILISDILGQNNINNNAQMPFHPNPNAVDLISLRNALDANRQISGLFITQLNHIIP